MTELTEEPTTPNQLVAFNLKLARNLRGWTQDEAAIRLEPLLGTRWSKAVFSAAERSVDGRRAREFTADEIVAFALAFRLPVAWFFLPPDQASNWQPEPFAPAGGEPMPLARVLEVALGFAPEAAARLSGLRQMYPDAFAGRTFDTGNLETAIGQELAESDLTAEQLVRAAEAIGRILKAASASPRRNASSEEE
jgi:hypothetical protein